MENIERLVLQYLTDEKIELTPKNFTRAFYKIAASKDITTPEMAYVERFVKGLDKSEKDILPEDTTTTYELLEILSYRMKNSQLNRFIRHLKTLMKPSVDHSVTYDIEKLTMQLSNNPHNLVNDRFVKKLIAVSDERVSKDRLALKNKSEDIKNITDLMINYFVKSLNENDNTNKDVLKINAKIKDIKDNDLGAFKKEVEKLLTSFNEVLSKNKEDLLKGQEQCDQLQEKIKKLEKNLLEIQKDKNIDYLTGILNRRGFMDEIQKADNEYEVFGSEYAIIFFDLDYFKEVNDKHGHECGDVVLATFAKLIKQLTRVEDVVARYGGEEFVALVHYEQNNELENYLTRVKYMVNKNSFKYKDLRVKITFSAGVALRSKNNTFDETINYADSLLLEAKNGGRNRIFFDDGLVL